MKRSIVGWRAILVFGRGRSLSRLMRLVGSAEKGEEKERSTRP